MNLKYAIKQLSSILLYALLCSALRSAFCSMLCAMLYALCSTLRSALCSMLYALFYGLLCYAALQYHRDCSVISLTFVNENFCSEMLATRSLVQNDEVKEEKMIKCEF